VVLSADAAVADLAFAGGNLSGTGVLTVTNIMDWTGGTVSGKLLVPATATLRIDNGGAKYLNACAVTNWGTVTWAGTNSLLIQNGARWVNETSGLFDILGDAKYDYNGGDAGSFLNRGILRKSGGTGTTTFDQTPFTNTGLLELRQGTLRLSGNYAPSTGAVTRILLAGPDSPGNFGRLSIGGTAQLDGLLEVRLANGYVPPGGMEYGILDAAAITATFQDYASDLTESSHFINPVYSATQIRLVTVGPSATLLGCRVGTQDGLFHFAIQGIAGQAYRVDASTNLIHWSVLATNVIPGSTLWEFADPDTSQSPKRFYRAIFLQSQ